MSEKQLRDLIGYASGFAEKRFAKVGALSPMYHAVRSNGAGFVMPAPMGAGKDVGVAIARATFEIEDVVRYVFLDEAWSILQPMSDKELAQVQEHGARSHPACIEVVMITGEDAECGLIMCHRRIIRPAKGKARLGPLEGIADTLPDFQRGGHTEGRMVGLLPVKGRMQ